MKCETSEEKWVMYPVFKIKEGSNNLEPEPAIKNEAGILAMVTFMHINGEGDTKEIPEFTVKTAERTPVRNYIVLKAIEFPWINLVWAGTIIMVVGFTFSVINRIKQQKNIMAA
jgi:cytochrome c-type biogenesis protein CcmF